MPGDSFAVAGNRLFLVIELSIVSNFAERLLGAQRSAMPVVKWNTCILLNDVLVFLKALMG